jgi:ATP-dependent Clp protease ATP-binding subunit ClpA
MIGFGATVQTGSPRAMIDRMFAPEFRNRLSAIIEFAPLPPAVIERVVDKFLLELSERLEANKVTMEVTPAAKKWLAERGYDSRFGARPLGRLIENEIARVLADDVLFGRLTKGGRVVVDLDGDKLAFSYGTAEATAPPTDVGTEA